uniref:AAR2 C-terminal domain-containing protein n=1 Tax=Skeletonema marinoi TaxID=267567 RepID=A0A7S2LVD1_9STRA
MESSTPQSSSNNGGCIILLDVPPGSSITVDGITRLTPSSPSLSNSSSTGLSSSPFHHNGVLVISGIPTSSDDQFHLLIVRCGSTNKQNQRDCDIRTLPIGFILTNPSSNRHTTNELGCDWIFARRHDPQTEELSNHPIDELTLNNLLLAMTRGGELATASGGMMGGNFIMSYDQFMQTPAKSDGSSGNRNGMGVLISSWGARTSCINSEYLQRRHDLTHGDKIVPSSYDQEEDNDIQNRSTTSSNSSSNDNQSAQQAQRDVDGKQISYPRIPCIDPSINARRLTQHAGTRSYLSKLSPETRTKLLLGRGGDDSFHVGEYVWDDILSRVYNNNSSSSSGGNGKEHDFLGDIQLSFLMFLFLECHTSLEHWRDAISMCSLAVMMPTDASNSATNDNSNNNLLRKHSNFFQQLLSIIHDQFLCIETEFFQEVEYSSGQKNFLIQALERICGACDDLVEGEVDGLKLASLKLNRMLRDRFDFDLSSSLSGRNGADMEIEEECPPIVYEGNNTTVGSEQNHDLMEHEYDDDDEDEDGPVIVPYEEFESSLSRSAALLNTTHKQVDDTEEEAKHRQDYPLLYAAMSPQEDVVMCAARVLDEQRDVSLVREAAAYLEQVEAHRCSL